MRGQYFIFISDRNGKTTKVPNIDKKLIAHTANWSFKQYNNPNWTFLANSESNKTITVLEIQ